MESPSSSLVTSGKIYQDIDRQKAAYEKDLGNKLFKSSRYKEAVDHYSRGIQCDPTEPTILCNRAMAYLKLHEYGKAKIDCDLAVALDPTYVKAFYRRALAYLGMNDAERAKTNFQRVLELEPSNRLAMDELKKLESLKGDTKSNRSSSLAQKLGQEKSIDQDSLVVQPVNNPPDEWKMQSMTRIMNIQEIHAPRTSGAPSADKSNAPISYQVDPPTSLTSFEFFKYWRSLGPKDKKSFGKYFMSIPVDMYRSLFGCLIDCDLLTDIVITFDDTVRENPSDNELLLSTLDRLLHLSQLERFQVAFAFLSDQQKRAVKEMMRKLSEAKSVAPGDDSKNLSELFEKLEDVLEI